MKTFHLTKGSLYSRASTKYHLDVSSWVVRLCDAAFNFLSLSSVPLSVELGKPVTNPMYQGNTMLGSREVRTFQQNFDFMLFLPPFFFWSNEVLLVHLCR